MLMQDYCLTIRKRGSLNISQQSLSSLARRLKDSNASQNAPVSVFYTITTMHKMTQPSQDTTVKTHLALSDLKQVGGRA